MFIQVDSSEEQVRICAFLGYINGDDLRRKSTNFVIHSQFACSFVKESVKNSRKTLKVLQKEAVNKENLIGRSPFPEKNITFKKSKS